MSWFFSLPTADENRVLLVDRGIVPVLKQVFQKYMKSASLMNHACIVTANLASFNGRTCFIEDLFSFSESGLILFLSWWVARNSDLMTSLGILPLLQYVLMEHMELSFVMQNAGLAVWNMIYIGTCLPFSLGYALHLTSSLFGNRSEFPGGSQSA